MKTTLAQGRSKVASAYLMSRKPGLSLLPVPDFVKCVLVKVSQKSRIMSIKPITHKDTPATVDSRAMQKIKTDSNLGDSGRPVSVFTIVDGDMNESPDESDVQGFVLRDVLGISPDDFHLDLRRLFTFASKKLAYRFLLLFSIRVALEHTNGNGCAAPDNLTCPSAKKEPVGDKGGGKSLEKIEGVTDGWIGEGVSVSVKGDDDSGLKFFSDDFK